MWVRIGDDTYINTDHICELSRISYDGYPNFDICLVTGEQINISGKTAGEVAAKKFKLLEYCGGKEHVRL